MPEPIYEANCDDKMNAQTGVSCLESSLKRRATLTLETVFI